MRSKGVVEATATDQGGGQQSPLNEDDQDYDIMDRPTIYTVHFEHAYLVGIALI